MDKKLIIGLSVGIGTAGVAIGAGLGAGLYFMGAKNTNEAKPVIPTNTDLGLSVDGKTKTTPTQQPTQQPVQQPAQQPTQNQQPAQQPTQNQQPVQQPVQTQQPVVNNQPSQPAYVPHQTTNPQSNAATTNNPISSSTQQALASNSNNLNLTWSQIVATYPKGAIGAEYAHGDVINFGGILYRVKQPNLSGESYAIASGLHEDSYPPLDPNVPHPIDSNTGRPFQVNGVDIQLWEEVPQDSVGPYQKPAGTFTASVKNLVQSGSAASDAVTSYDPTQQKVLDPSVDFNTHINKQVIDQYTQELKNVTHDITASAKITPAPAGSAIKLLLPVALNFTGQDQKASISKLDIDASVAPLYDFTIFKFTDINNAANHIHQMDWLGDLSNDLSDLKVSNADQVVLVAFKKRTHEIVQAAQYEVAGLGGETKTVTALEDMQLTEKLTNGTAAIEDVFKFMDSLKPGVSYTSQAATGGIKSLIIPDGKAIRAAFPTPNKASTTPSIYAPFLDITQTKLEDVAKLKNYKALTMAFIQTSATENGSVFSWGGVPVTDLGFSMTQDASKKDVKEWNDNGKIFQQIEELRKQGTDVAISLGGQSGTPLWQFHDPIIMAKALEELIIGSQVTRLDYDIEGSDIQDKEGMRAIEIATSIVQQKMRAEGKTPVEISLTIASEWDGFRDGTKITNDFIAQGVEVKYVNGMTMMMAPDKTSGLSIAEQQAQAIDHIKDQVMTAFNAAGVTISEEQAYRMVGATPDIGGDTWENEKMKPTDIEPLYQMLLDKKVGWFAYWNVQATENIGGGLQAYMAADSDWNNKLSLMREKMSRIFTDPAWGAEDPDYHGLQALTNNEARAKIIKDLQDFYGSKGSVGKAQTILSAADIAGKVLHTDEEIYYENPTDHLEHIYKVKYYAEINQRPDNAPAGQFEDLGVAPDDSIQKQIDHLQELYLQAGMPLWSVNGGNAASGSSIVKQKVDIMPWAAQNYPKPKTVVIYNAGFWDNLYWVGADTAPSYTDAYSTWQPIQMVKDGKTFKLDNSTTPITQISKTPTAPSHQGAGGGASGGTTKGGIMDEATARGQSIKKGTIITYNGFYYEALNDIAPDYAQSAGFWPSNGGVTYQQWKSVAGPQGSTTKTTSSTSTATTATSNNAQAASQQPATIDSIATIKARGVTVSTGTIAEYNGQYYQAQMDIVPGWFTQGAYWPPAAAENIWKMVSAPAQVQTQNPAPAGQAQNSASSGQTTGQTSAPQTSQLAAGNSPWAQIVNSYPEWSVRKQTSLGHADIVRYNGELYQFISDHATAEVLSRISAPTTPGIFVKLQEDSSIKAYVAPVMP